MNITDKQADLLRRLAAERVVIPGLSADESIARVDVLVATNAIDRRRASQMIEAALAAPKRQAQDTPLAAARPGYYVTDAGDFVVVVENRARTKTYAKVLLIEKRDGRTHASWTYTAGMAAHVAHLTPMTVAQAIEFGHLHGICIRCLKPLTDPVSALVGYGEKCAEHMDWPYPRTKAERNALLAAEANACTPGQQCQPMDRLCTKHSMEYQSRYGRAANE